jgi:branched-chain amino acid transport system ATP-binding protein
MSALLLRDLTVERGGRAVVRDVSVEIPAGQVTALLGPNGAGKSTLVLAVGGVIRPKAGSVLLDDTDPKLPKDAKTPEGPQSSTTTGSPAVSTGSPAVSTGPAVPLSPAGPGNPTDILDSTNVTISNFGPTGPPNLTDLTGRRPERIRQAGVAIVPEGRRLLPDLTVEDNLRVASYALSREATQAGRDRVLQLFPQLGQRLAALARTLSGGEQQMVVLAQALISQPRYLLIDELSLGLAPVVVSRLIPVIRTVAESGTGVLLIEQFATVALGLANHAHIMEGGRIRFSGPAGELRDNPDLLRSAYLLRGSKDKPDPPTAQPGPVTPLTGRNPLFSRTDGGPPATGPPRARHLEHAAFLTGSAASGARAACAIAGGAGNRRKSCGCSCGSSCGPARVVIIWPVCHGRMNRRPGFPVSSGRAGKPDHDGPRAPTEGRDCHAR